MENLRSGPSSKPCSRPTSRKSGTSPAPVMDLYMSPPATVDASIALIPRASRRYFGRPTSLRSSLLQWTRRASSTPERPPMARFSKSNPMARRPSTSPLVPNTSGPCASAKMELCTPAPAIRARFSKSPRQAKARSTTRADNRTLPASPSIASGACWPVATRTASCTASPRKARRSCCMTRLCRKSAPLSLARMAPSMPQPWADL